MPTPQENNDLPNNKKTAQLQSDVEVGFGQDMTSNQGLKINNDQHSLKTGTRGATLLEDFLLREKITHFDHERIPERVVHARGAGAHGVFELYESQEEFTKAGFLTDVNRQTPVFVRFSTVAGSRGSTDLARDVRGFAVKFYTEEGNFDLVGNNMPVFFIQDAIKFPDLIHAVKPEPHNEIPQAASAHDTFWDFISLMPESMHMVMWVMSDRAIPRSYRMMEGFGVHSFRFINEAGKSHFVKFHWKPLLGVHSVAWDEAQKISGKDPDFHRRDLWEAIENGAFPEWELGIQVIPEENEHDFDFDLLDPTKLIPEELVPVRRIGRLTLNRNPDNFFAETEQVAFHVGNIVPGIDFTNDPLMQGRLFSYTDTQLIRLGGPNFHEIPINRPVVPVNNNQRDGHMRQQINKGRTSYHPNSLNSGCPFQAGMKAGGFSSYAERIDGRKIRERSESFLDHFSQAKLFFNSQSTAEQQHIVDALSFELGKVKTKEIRERMIGLLNIVSADLAKKVADHLGMPVKEAERPFNKSVGADEDPGKNDSIIKEPSIAKSAALSMEGTIKDRIATRVIAILVADGVDGDAVMDMQDALKDEGAMVDIIAPHGGTVTGAKTEIIPVSQTFLTASSVMYDAVYVPGGKDGVTALTGEPDAIHFLNEAFRHCKAIALDKTAESLLDHTYFKTESGVLVGKQPELVTDFISAIAKHRFWEREKPRKVPA